MYGMTYLKNKLAKHQIRCRIRYDVYEMKRPAKNIKVFDDSRFDWLKCTAGWCTKAVDCLADRLAFKGWENDNFKFSEIFSLNNPDIFFDSAIISALITSCAFVYISNGDDGNVRLEVIDGRDATGIIDPTTNLLKEGYAVLAKDDNGNPTLEAYFKPGKTTFYPQGEESYSVEYICDYPLLVPVIYRPDAKRPFGHSRISRAMMDISESVMRTLKRAEISAEFYSFPQKYVLGTSNEREALDKLKATASSLLEITKDEDGDKPTVGQFTQQSMQPFSDQVKMYAAVFAGETGLTMDDLGFISENPSSAEAIKAGHDSLKVLANKAQRTFGACFLNVGFLAACIRDGVAYKRNRFYDTKPIWYPVFEPDAAALASIGDGAIKINQAIPGYIGKDNMALMTGVEPSTDTEDAENAS